MIDKERTFEKEEEKKTKLSKTFGNWLQAFAILAGVLCLKHPQFGAELFVYLDTIYSIWYISFMAVQRGGITTKNFTEGLSCNLRLIGLP